MKTILECKSPVSLGEDIAPILVGERYEYHGPVVDGCIRITCIEGLNVGLELEFTTSQAMDYFKVIRNDY